MLKEKALKGMLSAIGAIVTYLSGRFTPLVIVLAVFEIFDYMTGIIAAVKIRGGLSSQEAMFGAVRKFCYFFLVSVAFLFDYVIVETSGILSLQLNWTPMFGVLTLCYLISTEGISILENLGDIGVEVPLLSVGLKLFRDQANKKSQQNFNDTKN